MGTSYPAGLDTLTNPSSTDSQASVSHAGQHTNANDAIEAIQAELGTNPKGSAASVKARLDTLTAGPASATDNAVARFDTTTGKLLQDSTATVDDNGRLTVPSGSTGGVVIGTVQQLVGTGSPEGVVTAPIGSTWTQTDSTVGVLRWIKATGAGNTGWKVDVGDTGTRSLISELLNGWTATVLQLRRIESTVSLRGVNLSGAAASPDMMYRLPAGFRPIGLLQWPVGRTAGATSDGGIFIDGNADIGVYGTTTSYTAARPNLMFQTGDPWPTSLPGVAI